MTALLVIAGISVAAFAGLMLAVQVCAKKKRQVRKSDCLIVLGSKVYLDGRLSHTLQFRCAAAAEAYRKGIAPAVIVCGGRGMDEPMPEAKAMRAELARLGVPEGAVLTEDASRNTRQNLMGAKALMESRQWKTCAIVTSDYHVQRALWIARNLGMDACGIPSKTVRTWKRFCKTRFRESASWIKYWIEK